MSYKQPLLSISVLSLAVLAWGPVRWGTRTLAFLIFLYLFLVYVLGDLVPTLDQRMIDMIELQPLEVTVTFNAIIGPYIEWHYKAAVLLGHLGVKFMLFAALRPDLMWRQGGYQILGQMLLAVSVSLYAMLRREIREKHNFLMTNDEEFERTIGIPLGIPLEAAGRPAVLASIPQPQSDDLSKRNLDYWKKTAFWKIRSILLFLTNQHFKDEQRERSFRSYASRLSQKEHIYMYASAALSSVFAAAMQYVRHRNEAYNLIALGGVVPGICLAGALLKSNPLVGASHPRREQWSSTLLYITAQTVTFIFCLRTGFAFKQITEQGGDIGPVRDAYVNIVTLQLGLIISRWSIDGLLGRYACICMLADALMGATLELLGVAKPSLFGGSIAMLGVYVGLTVQPSAERQLRIHHDILTRYGRNWGVQAGVRNSINLPKFLANKGAAMVPKISVLHLVEGESKTQQKEDMAASFAKSMVLTVECETIRQRNPDILEEGIRDNFHRGRSKSVT
ncbi:hypothetical protein DFJ77DRAFT_115603 [Powellomyces hirtus]|nr:hypothetical protein DFJ77DRAFT_115603 [Powellomyces hirtus]